MNSLESKCAILASTPQNRWYDLRFKPIVQLILKMQEEGTIKLSEVGLPVFQMLNIKVYAFEFSGEIYFLFINQVGRVTEFFHLEKVVTSYSNVIAGHIVLSSDGDPHQEVYIPSVAMSMGVSNNNQFISKIKAAL